MGRKKYMRGRLMSSHHKVQLQQQATTSEAAFSSIGKLFSSICDLLPLFRLAYHSTTTTLRNKGISTQAPINPLVGHRGYYFFLDAYSRFQWLTKEYKPTVLYITHTHKRPWPITTTTLPSSVCGRPAGYPSSERPHSISDSACERDSERDNAGSHRHGMPPADEHISPASDDQLRLSPGAHAWELNCDWYASRRFTSRGAEPGESLLARQRRMRRPQPHTAARRSWAFGNGKGVVQKRFCFDAVQIWILGVCAVADPFISSFFLAREWKNCLGLLDAWLIGIECWAVHVKGMFVGLIGPWAI
jgi:hypothetical protein